MWRRVLSGLSYMPIMVLSVFGVVGLFDMFGYNGPRRGLIQFIVQILVLVWWAFHTRK
jgi:hypothetical protein